MYRRYDMLFEYARDVILITAPDGSIIDVNDAALRTYGFTRDELLSRHVRDLRPAVTASEVSRQLSTARTEGVLFETVHVRKDGTHFPVEISSRSTLIDGEELLIGIVRDISDRKRVEAAHDALLAELEARIEERTAALTRANAALTAQVDAISSARDLIDRQAQEIRALVAPVIQLWEGILVAPLVGELDPRRIDDLSSRLLDEVATRGAHAVLLDITGAATLDAPAAAHLLRLVSATRLLGATTLLTGVKPATAQTLVTLGIDLAGVATSATLAAGLREVLGRLGMRIVGTGRREP
ncbi:PAS domain S-box protein [Chondromyces apiculatus]|uniref:RsbR, positive regulator of sigma-B n=1 Tax=Chondromyces apiculatus DSM 436 TaxID=1192034 RepID=A0A017TBD6_9BACT|nr:PAS domain S-box protein [Chondromyces apiculatus]EYF06130.1 Hypothetical protein CAP_2320 [Chondromyces apiculatus DSM 436]